MSLVDSWEYKQGQERGIGWYVDMKVWELLVVGGWI